MDTHQPVLPETVNEIEFYLREISAIIKRKGRDILADFPITPPQFSALVWLDRDGDMTIGELSQKMYIACSTMTDLIDRMEKNKLVTRVRDERDRRVVQVQLLNYGKEVIGQVLASRQAYLSRVLDAFSQDQALEIERVSRMLYKQMTKK